MVWKEAKRVEKGGKYEEVYAKDVDGKARRMKCVRD